MSSTPPPFRPPPPPPAVQQRLGQVFEHGKRSFEKSDWEYAHTLFSQCVCEMPGSLLYLQHFRANLAKLHAGAKRAATLSGLLPKGSPVTKLVDKERWAEAFQAGCDALKKNRDDTVTLRELARAAGELGHADCQLFYLKWALDADPLDAVTNQQAAAVLTGIKEFEQAIACWRRVLQKKPNDEQARKAIAGLGVEKTIHDGGYDPTLLGGDGEAPLVATARVADLAQRDAEDPPKGAAPPADEATLLAAIDAAPGDANAYVALADFYAAQGHDRRVERLLAKAVDLAEDPLPVTERLEEARLRRVRTQVYAAQQQGDQEAYRRTLRHADQVELEVYSARAERKPGDLRLLFDVGVRLKRLGRHREAIQALQAARGDSRRAAETHLYLGECFQQIKQFKLAATSYEAALAASADAAAEAGGEELRKLALYRAGVLAMGLGEIDRAEERLTELASYDFGYRDVADRLDKIATSRNDT